MNDAPGERKVYRTRSQVIGLAFIAVAGLAASVIGAVHGRGGTSRALIYSPIPIFGVLLLIRAAATALIVDDQGVIVRTLLRTVNIPWAGIAKFEVGRYKILGCVLIIHRTDGSVLPVFAVQGITRQPRRQTSVAARAAADELNERLRRVAGDPVYEPVD